MECQGEGVGEGEGEEGVEEEGVENTLFISNKCYKFTTMKVY